jgi:hypothetical protein
MVAMSRGAHALFSAVDKNDCRRGAVEENAAFLIYKNAGRFFSSTSSVLVLELAMGSGSMIILSSSCLMSGAFGRHGHFAEGQCFGLQGHNRGRIWPGLTVRDFSKFLKPDVPDDDAVQGPCDKRSNLAMPSGSVTSETVTESARRMSLHSGADEGLFFSLSLTMILSEDWACAAVVSKKKSAKVVVNRSSACFHS